MNCSFTLRRCDNRNIDFDVTSGPWSQTMVFGNCRLLERRSSSFATRWPEIEKSTICSTHSRVKSLHDVEHPEPATVGELVRHKVDPPALVDSARYEHRGPRDVEPLSVYAAPEALPRCKRDRCA